MQVIVVGLIALGASVVFFIIHT